MKKVLMVFMVTVLSSILVISASAASAKMGDVDGNGKISAADARLALRISAGLDTATDAQKGVADVDGNGKITASDARLILRYSAGLDVTFVETSTVYEPDESTEKSDSTTSAAEETATVEPATEQPTSEEPTTIVNEGEATTIDGTTVVNEGEYTTVVTTDENITEKPTTGEPTTEEPATHPVPEETVAYSDFPEQLKSFINGKFDMDSSYSGPDGKQNISMISDGEQMKVNMPMSLSGSKTTNVSMVVLKEKTLFGKDKLTTYIVFEDQKKYMDTSLLETFGMDVSMDGMSFNFAGDTESIVAKKSIMTEDDKEYSIYSFNNGELDVMLEGDNIVKILSYDTKGDVQSNMEVTRFSSEIPENAFSLGGYEKLNIVTLTSFIASLM